MSWNEIEANWERFQDRVRAYWGKLTDEDLEAVAGRRQQLERRLTERYGYDAERARLEVEDFCRQLPA